MPDFVTTAELARMLSVSPDTVLKWVRAGKIPCYKTPGGHARIPSEVAASLLPRAGRDEADDAPAALPVFRHCWEYYGEHGCLRDECRDCVAYRSRARRCYEMRAIPEEFGHLKLHCSTTCEECEYYRHTRDSLPGVLIVTRDRPHLGSVEAAGTIGLRLGIAGDEYECALEVGRLRPDWVVLDASLGRERLRRVCEHVARDERIPLARVVVASRTAAWAADCEQSVFGWIRKPFTVDELRAFVEKAAGGADPRPGHRAEAKETR